MSLLLRSTVFSMCYMCVRVSLFIVVVVISVRFVCVQCSSHSLYITITNHCCSDFQMSIYACVQCVWLCGVLVTEPLIWRWHCTMIRFYHRIQCHMLVCSLSANKIDHIAASTYLIVLEVKAPVRWNEYLEFIFFHLIITLHVNRGFFCLSNLVMQIDYRKNTCAPVWSSSTDIVITVKRKQQMNLNYMQILIIDTNPFATVVWSLEVALKIINNDTLNDIFQISLFTFCGQSIPMYSMCFAVQRISFCSKLF